MIEVLKHPGATPQRSTGYVLLSWLHHFIPNPADATAATYLEDSPLAPDLCRYLIYLCSTDEAGKRYLHSEGALVLPKGSWKSGIGAMLSLAEIFAPTVPAGIAKGGETIRHKSWTYTYAPGEVMANVRPSPHVTILATSKEQALKTCYQEVWKWAGGADEGGSERLIMSYGIRPRDHVSKMKFTSPSGATISVMAAEHSADTADGGKETLVVLDESHRMTGSVIETAQTLMRNAKKRAGRTVHTTTIFALGGESYLEKVFARADEIRAGQTPLKNLLIHHAKPSPHLDLADGDELRQALKEVYSSAPFVDVEPLWEAFYDSTQDDGELKRFYLGIPTTPTRNFLEIELLQGAITAPADWRPPTGTKITLGLDASKGVDLKSDYLADCTALVGCAFTEGDEPPVIFPIRIWVPRDTAWRLDFEDLDTEVRRAFETWDVVGFYADPAIIQHYVAAWERDYRKCLRVYADTSNRPIAFQPNRLRDMSLRLKAYREAIYEKAVALTKDPILVQHHQNARTRPSSSHFSVGKEREHSPKKIDALISSVLAFAAYQDALAAGASLKDVKKRRPTRIVQPRYV